MTLQFVHILLYNVPNEKFHIATLLLVGDMHNLKLTTMLSAMLPTTNLTIEFETGP
jgi:hypothetical protein